MIDCRLMMMPYSKQFTNLSAFKKPCEHGYWKTYNQPMNLVPISHTTNPKADICCNEGYYSDRSSRELHIVANMV